jgi:hypothetical protein
MGTFLVSFHILQIFQILNNSLAGMPSLSVGADRQARSPHRRRIRSNGYI